MSSWIAIWRWFGSLKLRRNACFCSGIPSIYRQPVQPGADDYNSNHRPGSRLTVAGSSTSEGFITRSTNATIVTFAGYDADSGTTGIAATTAGTVNRIVGQLDSSGNFTRTASGSSTAL